MSYPGKLKRPKHCTGRDVLLFFGMSTMIVFVLFGVEPSGKQLSESLDLAEQNAQVPKQLIKAYGNMPMHFEENLGQTDENVQFLSRGNGYTVFLTSEEAVLSLRRQETGNRRPEKNDDGQYTDNYLAPRAPNPESRTPKSDVLRMRLVGANPDPEISGQDELSGKSHYFLGSASENWCVDIANYSKVLYKEVYPGIDLAYYGNQGQLEYDFVVSPGSDPQAIMMEFQGADEHYIDEDDNFILKIGGSEIVLRRPITYQKIGGIKQMVPGEYTLNGKNQVRFQVDHYDPDLPLIIDPVIVYCTYLGGSVNGWEGAYGVAVDNEGCAYVTGYARSTDFPIFNAFQPEISPDQFGNPSFEDVFVTKFNSEGVDIIYSTYVGGGSSDQGYAIAVDMLGNAYVTGKTQSRDNPDTPADEGFPYRNEFRKCEDGMGDAFVFKLSTAGNDLLYASCIGGGNEDKGHDIAVDLQGNCYITGMHQPETFGKKFPTSDNAFQKEAKTTGPNVFVAKFDPTKSGDASRVYATLLSGSTSYEDGNGIAVDDLGHAYVTGRARSSDFPTENPIQGQLNGSSDAFITKMNLDGSDLVYSTYLGGSGSDGGEGIVVDDAGNAYVTGSASSDFFTTPGAFVLNTWSSFVTKINPEGNDRVYAARFGSANQDIDIDGEGNAYTVDWGARGAKLNSTGTDTIFTFKIMDAPSNTLTGRDIALDGENNIYITGMASTPDLPVENAYQPELKGISDGFVAKLTEGDRIKIVEIDPDPDDVSHFYWEPGVMRPGQEWTFDIDVEFSLVSAENGRVVLDILGPDGLVFSVKMQDVQGGTKQKLHFQSQRIKIPETDGIDTLKVRVHLFPSGKIDPTASDRVRYRYFEYYWTFMVYMGGDCDLERAAMRDLAEMASVEGSDSLAIVVLLDRHPKYDSSLGDWAETRLYFMKQDPNGGFGYRSLGEMNMGNPGTLEAFVIASMREFPARRYALVLWNHGGGWTEASVLGKTMDEAPFPDFPPGIDGAEGFKDVIIDETDNDRLFSAEIRGVLDRLPHLDILGVDACLNAMTENAYQFRNGASYFVAHEDVEPGQGWPYDVILGQLKDKPEMAPADLARMIVREYGDSYPVNRENVTCSATDFSKVGSLKDAVNTLAVALIEKKPWKEVEMVLERTHRFYLPSIKDLYHFAQLLRAETQHDDVYHACGGVMQAVDSAVVENHFSLVFEEDAHGLSIYLPECAAQYGLSYSKPGNISLSDDTQWDEFLLLYLLRRTPPNTDTTRIEHAIFDSYEPNETISQAWGPLIPQTQYYAYIPHAGDKDFYFISPGIETDLTVELTSPGGINYDLVVYAPNGVAIGFSVSQTSPETLTLQGLPPSPYYIEVVAGGDYVNVPYKLEVDYMGSGMGRIPLSFDDGDPSSSLYSSNENDIIGTYHKAPAYPMNLNEVSFYIESPDGAGMGGDGSFNVWLADYYGPIADPFRVTPNGTTMGKASAIPGWFTVDLTDMDITLQSQFFVGIGYDGQNTPSLGIDTVANGMCYQWDANTNTWLPRKATAFIRTTVSYLETPERVHVSMPDNLEGPPGSAIDVPVTIDNTPAEGIDTLEMEISFDSDVLKFKGISFAGNLTGDWQIQFMDSLRSGRLQMKVAGGTQITTGGVLFQLNFQVMPTAAPGRTADIRFDRVLFNGGRVMVQTKPGVFTVPGGTQVDTHDSDFPNEFRLHQNHPNPFNPTTKIAYMIPKSLHVKLEIYNLMGTKIRTLVDGQQQAGQYTVVWDSKDENGSSVSGGMYLYRLQAGAFVEVRKMLLIR